MAKRCNGAVWVGPAKTTSGVAIYRKRPGRRMRFANARTARRFVRAIVKHEGACFTPTAQLKAV